MPVQNNVAQFGFCRRQQFARSLFYAVPMAVARKNTSPLDIENQLVDTAAEIVIALYNERFFRKKRAQPIGICRHIAQMHDIIAFFQNATERDERRGIAVRIRKHDNRFQINPSACNFSANARNARPLWEIAFFSSALASPKH